MQIEKLLFGAWHSFFKHVFHLNGNQNDRGGPNPLLHKEMNRVRFNWYDWSGMNGKQKLENRHPLLPTQNLVDNSAGAGHTKKTFLARNGRGRWPFWLKAAI